MSQDTRRVLSSAAAAGVGFVVVPGVDPESSRRAVLLSREYAGTVVAAAGVHPQAELYGTDDGALSEIAVIARSGAVAAIGEIGLDAEKGPTMDIQERRFACQLELAQGLGLPVLVHCRGAFARLLAIVRSTGFSRGGIMHSWSGSAQSFALLSDAGFYAGVSGVASRAAASRVRSVVAAIPMDRLVLETDAPYIGTGSTPRGLTDPSSVAEVCMAVASLKGVSFGTVAGATTANARAALGLAA
jgi:TatD DNase family protein